MPDTSCHAPRSQQTASRSRLPRPLFPPCSASLHSVGSGSWEVTTSIEQLRIASISDMSPTMKAPLESAPEIAARASQLRARVSVLEINSAGRSPAMEIATTIETHFRISRWPNSVSACRIDRTGNKPNAAEFR